MNARARQEFEHRKTLQNAGWDVPQSDGVRFNSGSETLEHFLAKATIAWVLKQDGYRVASEVTKDGAGEIDLIAYGTDDPPVVVEAETNWQDGVLADKVSRYVKGEPYRDILPVEVTEMPDVSELQQWADAQV